MWPGNRAGRRRSALRGVLPGSPCTILNLVDLLGESTTQFLFRLPGLYRVGDLTSPPALLIDPSNITEAAGGPAGK